MKPWVKWSLIAFVALIVFGAIFGKDEPKNATTANTEPNKTTSQPVVEKQAAEIDAKAQMVDQQAKALNSMQPTESNDVGGLTTSQKNAVRKAEQYLDFKAFSRDGLIQQLSSQHGDGFSKADATAAVDSLTVDWNEQAAKAGKAYLDMQGFSCKGLIQQLSSKHGDQYTKAQAEYGAKQAGACS